MTASNSEAPNPSSPSPPLSGPDEATGHRVVLWLFLILALSVIGAFALFYGSTRPVDRAFIVPAVLRDLYLPVVATSILVAIDAKGRDRSGWWIYLITAPVPGVNIGLSAAWLLRWRRKPGRFWRWEL